MATAVQIPQPLTSEEIIEGIAVRIVGAAQVKAYELLGAAIRASLAQTCSLNRSVYSKFSAKWWIEFSETEIGLRAKWWVDYALDDFGRVTRGGIGGRIGVLTEEHYRVEGEIEEMPPDRFRRETKQPIPAAQVIKPKDPNLLGMTHSQRVSVKRKDA